MEWYNHLGILLFLVVCFNLVESFNEDPFNNAVCHDKWIPTFSAFILFGLLELFILIGYMILVW